MSKQEFQKLFSEYKFQELITEVDKLDKPDPKSIEFKANSLFELGEFEAAIPYYEHLKAFANVGFCYLMLEDFENAREYYLKAETSSAKKWGLFLLLLLSRASKSFPGPGFLTFRLFFQTSYCYFLRFAKNDYIKRINESLSQLKVIYPDIESEIDKAKSII